MFRPYLHGRKFIFVTDHKPLVWFQNSKDPRSRVTRWKLKLAEYDFDVIYKAGKTNVNGDALPRNPVEEPESSNSINIVKQKMLRRNNGGYTTSSRKSREEYIYKFKMYEI